MCQHWFQLTVKVLLKTDITLISYVHIQWPLSFHRFCLKLHIISFSIHRLTPLFSSTICYYGKLIPVFIADHHCRILLIKYIWMYIQIWRLVRMAPFHIMNARNGHHSHVCPQDIVTSLTCNLPFPWLFPLSKRACKHNFRRMRSKINTS